MARKKSDLSDNGTGLDVTHGMASKSIFLTVRIEGISPLLMHKFTDEAQRSVTSGNRSASGSPDRGTPRDQAEAVLYTDDDGAIILPQPNLMVCLIEAGRFFRSGKRMISTRDSSILPGVIIINNPYFYLEYNEPWTVFSTPVTIPSTKGRIVRHRPMFNDWAVTFSAEIDVSELALSVVREIVDAAGKKVGLCDFRPARRGPYGRFVVTQWDVDDYAER